MFIYNNTQKNTMLIYISQVRLSSDRPYPAAFFIEEGTI